MPAPPSVVPLPPSPTTTRRAPASTAADDQLADATRRGLLGTVLLGQVQAARLRALDVRRVPGQQHRGGRRLAERSRDGGRQQLAAERLVEHVDEAGTAVGHRRQVEGVVRCPPAPAGRDRLGGLHGGQRAGELVGGHQDAHGVIQPGSAPAAARRRARWTCGRGCRAARGRSTPPRPPPRPVRPGRRRPRRCCAGCGTRPVMTMPARKARQPAITRGVCATTAVTTPRSEVPTMRAPAARAAPTG